MTEIDVARRIRDADRDSKILRDKPSKLRRDFDSVAELSRGLGEVRHYRKQNSYRVERDLPRRPPAWDCEGDCNLRETERRCYGSILPTFDGSSLKLDFLDWIDTFEDYFQSVNLPEAVKCELVASKLKGEALLWWTELQNHTYFAGKNLINSWSRMRDLLHSRFLHTSRLTYFYKPKHENSINSTKDQTIEYSQADETVPPNCLMKGLLRADRGSNGETSAYKSTNGIPYSTVVTDNKKKAFTVVKQVEPSELISGTCSIMNPLEVCSGSHDNNSGCIMSNEIRTTEASLSLKPYSIVDAEKQEIEGRVQLIVKIDDRVIHENDVVMTLNSSQPKHIEAKEVAGHHVSEIDEILEAKGEQGMAIRLPKKIDVHDEISTNTEYPSFLFDPGILRACIIVSIEVLFEAMFMAGETPLKNFDPGGKPVVDGDEISGHHVNEVRVPSVLMTKIAVTDQEAWVMYGVNGKHGPNSSRIGNGVGSKVRWVERKQNRRQPLWSSNDVDFLMDAMLTLSFDPGGVIDRTNTSSYSVSKAEIADLSSVEVQKQKLLFTLVMEAIANLSSSMNQINQIVGEYKAVTNSIGKFSTFVFDPGVIWPIKVWTTSLMSSYTREMLIDFKTYPAIFGHCHSDTVKGNIVGNMVINYLCGSYYKLVHRMILSPELCVSGLLNIEDVIGPYYMEYDRNLSSTRGQYTQTDTVCEAKMVQLAFVSFVWKVPWFVPLGKSMNDFIHRYISVQYCLKFFHCQFNVGNDRDGYCVKGLYLHDVDASFPIEHIRQMRYNVRAARKAGLLVHVLISFGHEAYVYVVEWAIGLHRYRPCDFSKCVLGMVSLQSLDEFPANGNQMNSIALLGSSNATGSSKLVVFTHINDFTDDLFLGAMDQALAHAFHSIIMCTLHRRHECMLSIMMLALPRGFCLVGGKGHNREKVIMYVSYECLRGNEQKPIWMRKPDVVTRLCDRNRARGRTIHGEAWNEVNLLYCFHFVEQFYNRASLCLLNLEPRCIVITSFNPGGIVHSCKIYFKPWEGVRHVVNYFSMCFKAGGRKREKSWFPYIERQFWSFPSQLVILRILILQSQDEGMALLRKYTSISIISTEKITQTDCAPGLSITPSFPRQIAKANLMVSIIQKRSISIPGISIDGASFRQSMPWYFLRHMGKDVQHSVNLMRIEQVTMKQIEVLNARHSRKPVKLFHNLVNGLDPPTAYLILKTFDVVDSVPHHSHGVTQTKEIKLEDEFILLGADRDDVMSVRLFIRGYLGLFSMLKRDSI